MGTTAMVVLAVGAFCLCLAFVAHRVATRLRRRKVKPAQRAAFTKVHQSNDPAYKQANAQFRPRKRVARKARLVTPPLAKAGLKGKIIVNPSGICLLTGRTALECTCELHHAIK